MPDELFLFIETQETEALQRLARSVPALLKCDKWEKGSVVWTALAIAGEAAEAELALRATPVVQAG